MTTRTGVPVSRFERDGRARCGDRRPRRVQLVHAQGDRRTARRLATHRRGPRRTQSGVRSRQRRPARRGFADHDHGLRHVPQCRHGRSSAASALGGIPTTTAIASEWCGSAPLLDPGELVIGVTQSGETRDTVAALRLARDLGAPTIALTNAGLSQATREADSVLRTHAGLEVGVAATKTFTSQVVAFALLALYHGARRGSPLTPTISTSSKSELCRLPGLVTETIADVSDRSPRRRLATPTVSCSCTWAATSPTRSRARARSR